MSRSTWIAVLMLLTAHSSVWATTVERNGFHFVLSSSGEIAELMPHEEYLFALDPINVVVVGDGYPEADMARFEEAAKTTVEDFWTYQPFKSKPCGIAFWMVRLVSNDFGITNPDEATLANQDTALKSRFSSSVDRGISANAALCWDAIDASGVVDPDLICVLVSDPANHDGAWAYPGSNLMLMSDGWPWGVVLAHELGHLIADLGDEYPCEVCSREGNYPASEEWNRAYDPEVDEPIDNPNLTTNLDDIPWASSIWADDWPTVDVPTSNLNAFAGYTVGAWEGGGTFRKGVWRSEEYCVMDAFMSPAYEHFCEVCKAALNENMFDCFASTVNDCMMVSPARSPRVVLSDRTVLRDFVDLPPSGSLPIVENPFAYRLRLDIPPLWKLLSTPPDLPEPIPLTDVPVKLVMHNLPDGVVVSIYDQNGALLAQEVADGQRATVLEFRINTLDRYCLEIDGISQVEARRVRVELTVNGTPIPLD